MKGKINKDIIDVIFEVVPFDISVLDNNDKVVAWNKHATRIFKRPDAALGKNVRDCHPKKSLEKVEKILEEMRTGKRDKARFWIDLNIGKNDKKRKILIEYYALRDREGNYLGCLECSQDITEIQSIEGERRLLD